jgi:hypothetical protein
VTRREFSPKPSDRQAAFDRRVRMDILVDIEAVPELIRHENLLLECNPMILEGVKGKR